MPTDPATGQTINVPLSQEIEANSADRFDVLLRTPLTRTNISKIYFYLVHVYLMYDANNKLLDIGDIVVDLPQAPTAGEYYWNNYYAANPQVVAGSVYAPDMPAYKKCVIGNSLSLRTILSSSSERPAQLANILPQLRY